MISVNNLYYQIQNKILFNDLSFHIPKGKIGVILGPNGRGKTTLLRSILGLQKINTGQICLAAQSAYVPQLSQSLFTYNVKTMVSLGRIRHLRWYATPSKFDHQIINECIDYLGLSTLAEKPFNQLSGGEKQMVMIARALASQPDILILDEPTSALDLYNQDNVLHVLRELTIKRNMTILFTSHYPQHALHMADLALLLFPSNDYLFGEINQVMNEENMKKLYQIPIAITPVSRDGRTTQAVIPIFK